VPATPLPEPLGARNPRLAALRRLVERRGDRAEQQRFVVDGPVLATEALLAVLPVEAVFLDAGHLGAPEVDAVVSLALDRGVPVLPVATGLLGRIADPVTPRPVLAVVHLPPTGLELLPVPSGDDDFLLVAVAVADPGNLGTLVRTAEAAGATGLAVLGDATDPFSPKAVRASAGSVLRVPIAVSRDLGRGLDALASQWTLLATAADGEPLDHAALGPRPAVLLGSEAHGLDAVARDAASMTVAIPMDGAVESLNVGVAGAVLAFELARRRRTGSGRALDAR
jgi:RNA methyltransferase, TrmH family